MTAPADQGLFGMPQTGGEATATYEQITPQLPVQQGVTHPALAQQGNESLSNSAALAGAMANSVDNMSDYEDYWGFEKFHTFVMPDGKQTITFKTMTEGDIGRFNKMMKRDVVVEKRSGDARFRMDQSEERRALIMVAVVGWTLVKRGRSGNWEPAKFNDVPGGELEQWVNKANPEIIADLELAIRKANPTLISTGPETIEAIDKQITELQEQREEILARQRGEDSSATK